MPPSQHPGDANLSVTKAAKILGVHANTVRAWSDRGRLPYLRINERGDRRYRAADLVRFLEAAAHPRPSHGNPNPASARSSSTPAVRPLGAEIVEQRTRPTVDRVRGPNPGPTYARLVRISPGDGDIVQEEPWEPTGQRRPPPELAILDELISMIRPGGNPVAVMTAVVEALHDRAGHDLVAVLERRGDVLVPRIARGVGASQLGGMSAVRALPSRALSGTGPALEVAPPPHVAEWLAPGRLLHGRIAAPIAPAGAAAWGLLVVADEGSAAVRDWAPLVGAVARVLGLAVLVGAPHQEPSGPSGPSSLPAPLRAIQSLGARLARPAGGDAARPQAGDARRPAGPRAGDARRPAGPADGPTEP